MYKKSLKTLEFNKITDILEQLAISPMGKEAAKSLVPITDIDEIKLLQSHTTEATGMILKKGSLPLGGIKDIRASLKRATAYGVLNILELLQVGDFVYVCKKAINYSKAENKDDIFPVLADFFEQIQNLDHLENEIKKAIATEHELRDDASENLSDIRRNIRVASNRIKEHLNTIIHSSNYKNMLQDTVVTIRSGRYCVPIKQEYKNSFPGMIHDSSSTGATVFMEPMSVVNLNNKIKELLSKEQEEIDKILRKLSESVTNNCDILYANIEILTLLDFIFAKGELSLKMEATQPIFNNKGYIDIKRGKHPLIDKEKVVPADIYLGQDFTILLITGPNTGGKTVTLKTIGLFTLMGQAGLHVPASRAELAVFDNVFSDIGDEQSIEQNLSTFSSHMSNIVNVLKIATDNSLILLDELGAGTDPTEGAALAMAILDYLHQRQIRCAVTTHYSELKMYALRVDGVENASCEFDVETLMPTYRLLIGVPGKSNAFAISKKLGLEDHIITAAKNIISSDDEKIEDIITNLEISKRSVTVEQERAMEYRREAEVLRKELDRQKEKFEQQKTKILQKAKEEARVMLMQAKEEADEIIKEMVKQSKENDLNQVHKSRKQLEGKLDKLSDKPSMPKKQLKNVRVGDRVFIHSLGQPGTVSALPDGNKDVLVTAGIMKIKVPLSGLSLDESDSPKEIAKAYASSSIKASKSKGISMELDIRGCMANEGIELLDKYLDDACLANLSQVTIIHGKGTGALRTAIQNHLKKHPQVKSFRAGEFGEGDLGVTVIVLK